MKLVIYPLLLITTCLFAGCDRRDDPENAPTPQPTSETRTPPTDPEAPTAPVEGEPTQDDNTPTDRK